MSEKAEDDAGSPLEPGEPEGQRSWHFDGRIEPGEAHRSAASDEKAKVSETGPHDPDEVMTLAARIGAVEEELKARNEAKDQMVKRIMVLHDRRLEAATDSVTWIKQFWPRFLIPAGRKGQHKEPLSELGDEPKERATPAQIVGDFLGTLIIISPLLVLCYFSWPLVVLVLVILCAYMLISYVRWYSVNAGRTPDGKADMVARTRELNVELEPLYVSYGAIEEYIKPLKEELAKLKKEQRRLQEETRRAEEQKRAEEQRRLDEQSKRAEEQKKAEEQRRLDEQSKRAEEQKEAIKLSEERTWAGFKESQRAVDANQEVGRELETEIDSTMKGICPKCGCWLMPGMSSCRSTICRKAGMEMPHSSPGEVREATGVIRPAKSPPEDSGVTKKSNRGIFGFGLLKSMANLVKYGACPKCKLSVGVRSHGVETVEKKGRFIGVSLAEWRWRSGTKPGDNVFDGAPVSEITVIRAHRRSCDNCGHTWHAERTESKYKEWGACPECHVTSKVHEVSEENVQESIVVVGGGPNKDRFQGRSEVSFSRRSLKTFRCGGCKYWWRQKSHQVTSRQGICPFCYGDRKIEILKEKVGSVDAPLHTQSSSVHIDNNFNYAGQTIRQQLAIIRTETWETTYQCRNCSHEWRELNSEEHRVY